MDPNDRFAFWLKFTSTGARLGFAGGFGSTVGSLAALLATRQQALVFAIAFATSAIGFWHILGVVWRAVGLDEG